MRSHLRTLAILEIVYASMGLLVGLGILLLFGGIAAFLGMTDHSNGKEVAIPVMMLVGGAITTLITLLSLPRLIAGIGLLNCRDWARVLALILSAIGILEFPIGTAIGLYGIWVLSNPETIALCSRPSLRAA